MKINRVRQNVLPLVTAMIWGTAFVAQSVGAEYMGAFTFNAARAVIAFVFLLGFIGILNVISAVSFTLCSENMPIDEIGYLFLGDFSDSCPCRECISFSESEFV